MWILRNDEKGQLYGLTPGKQHVVSRKDGDLLLLNDQSISRKHAVLFVSEDGENNGICLKDLQSKYGTFTARGEEELSQLAANQNIVLHHNDHVRFGIQWNRWRVEYVPLLVATSTLTLEEKTEVTALVSVLGGRVLSEWNSKCTHLTMNKLTLTVKVVCTLAAGQPIVTPAFWKVFSQAFNSIQTTLPDCSQFLPPLAEAVLDPTKVSFHPDPARAKLFGGTTFVAITAKQSSRIKPMVEAAGGSVALFSPVLWTEKQLLEETTVLMQQSGNANQSSQQSQVPDGYIALARKMKAQGVRCIPESEIGLSVLYCSRTRYCNPRFNPQTLMSSNSFLETTEPVSVICPNTEEVTRSEGCSNSTAGSSRNPISKKRAKEDNSNEDHLNKKPKEESEDVFSSQHINLQNTEVNPRLSLRSSKSLMLKKNTTSENTDLAKENIPLQHDPSLDMFAPSGVRSSTAVNVSVLNQNEMRPSCEDMFGSGSSKRLNSKGVENKDEITSTTSKQPVKNTKPLSEDNNDEFSFPTKKRMNRSSVPDDDNDEFSFSANKRSKVQERPADGEEDEFSFASNRSSSNKRTRLSNPDMFASGETNHSSPVAGPSGLPRRRNAKERDETDFRRPKEILADDAFKFPEDSFAKRKRHNRSITSAEDASSNVNMALFSKSITDTLTSSLQNDIKPARNMDVPKGEKSLVTYSKNMATPTKVKQEIKNEEVDDLARELHNTTIVVVKSLLVIKPDPEIDSTHEFTTVKNFKKFRKVIGVKKPFIPKIIGGRDLVAHCRENDEHFEDDLQAVRSQKQTPDDDWNFLGDKKRKGRGR